MRIKGLFISCVALAIVALARTESEPNAHPPVLDMKDTDGKVTDVYRGFILNNEDTVSLVPELKATDKDEIGGARFICGYRISSDDYDIPFEAHVTNHENGKAKLKVKAGKKLSDYLRHKFKFQIAAFDCGSPTLHSEKAHVIVRVIPAPEVNSPPVPTSAKKLIDSDQLDVSKLKLAELNPPEKKPVDPKPAVGKTTAFPKLPLPDQGGESYFDRPSYIVDIREATLYDAILKLRRSAKSSSANICGYEIITPNVPFSVDASGNIKNTKALDYSVQKSYILSVVAKHCNGLVSKPTVVNIQVSQICTNGWKELPTNEEYKAGTKAIKPFADTWIDTCETSCEDNETLSVTVSLESQGQINTCQHDTYSIQSQRDTCGASSQSTDLLPQGVSWTEHLKPVEGHEAAYKFDGKTAVKVPSTRSNHTLDKLFTLSFWMQHGEEKKDGHKEHVLCNADGDAMNRHHYSLFVHNCRLVFLLRREADQVKSLDDFMPAEWRWTIPQVCSGKWHHYAVSVEYPTVKLFVDGQRIQDDKDIVEVVDDWALHPSDKVHFTQLTVGACWKGRSSEYGQYFDGALAGVTMVTGQTETERVIKCLNSCGEKLQFNRMELLQVGMSMSFNTELTEITIKGNDMEEVKKLLREVGYTNTNGNPQAGYRYLHVNTDMTCDGNKLTIKEQKIPILVSAVSDPEITIGGLHSKSRTTKEFASGVDVFTELMILSAPRKQLKEQENRVNKLDIEDINAMQKNLKRKLLLDRCEVRVDAKMDAEHEKLRLPKSLLIKYLMDTKEFDQGFDITGSETYEHYEEVLRETYYINSNVNKSFTGRTFTVTCSDMNNKFISNAFAIKVNRQDSTDSAAVLYSDPEYAKLAAGAIELEDNSFADSQAKNIAAASSGSSSGAVVAVVVVCVVLLIVVIAVAIARIRAVQRARGHNPNITVEDGPEMEWDNSTLNITVNPLETDDLVQHVKSSGASEVDSEEEEMMSSDDEGDDSGNKDGGLEWDNSTLSY